MKRSRSVTLSLMVGTAALALAGCNEAPTEDLSPVVNLTDYAFKSADECISAGLRRGECVLNFDLARKSHVAKAPRFPTKEECEAVIDADCESAQFSKMDGGMESAWVPRMDGFLFTLPPDDWQTGGEETASSTNGSAGGGGGAARNHFFYSTPLYGSRSRPGNHLDLASLSNFASSKSPARPYVSKFGFQAPPSGSSRGSSSFLSSTSIPRSSFGNARTTTVSRGIMSSSRSGSFGG